MNSAAGVSINCRHIRLVCGVYCALALSFNWAASALCFDSPDQEKRVVLRVKYEATEDGGANNHLAMSVAVLHHCVSFSKV